MTDYTAEEIAEHRHQWAEALKSGNYKQGMGYLLTGDADGNKRYCCLGVAAELSGCQTRDTDIRSSSDCKVMQFYDPDDPEGDFSESELPRRARLWLGVGEHTGDPVIEGEGGFPRYASALNDVDGATFDQIGNMIEGGTIRDRLASY